MSTSTRKMPRLSRAKTMFATLAASAALMGVVQAATPAPAAAVPNSYCNRFLYLSIITEPVNRELSHIYFDMWANCEEEADEGR